MKKINIKESFYCDDSFIMLQRSSHGISYSLEFNSIYFNWYDYKRKNSKQEIILFSILKFKSL